MGISRDSRHKRRATGGRMPIHKKKRAFEKGRQAAMTKLFAGQKRVRRVRVRGGNFKFRALRLFEGNFAWGSEQVTKKTKIIDTVYHPSNNELVRTKTLTKGAIIQVDPTPFKLWYQKHYDVDLGAKKVKKGEEKQAAPEQKRSKTLQQKMQARQKERVIDQLVQEQFAQGRILARINSRPGQSGRADGYLLEGKELEFYVKKIEQKKK